MTESGQLPVSTHLTEAAVQLGWWLRLPPTNLIDRGDHVRFRYALYLIIHQVATVLYGINELPHVMYYPSRIAGARDRLNGLSRAPDQAGDALWSLATERDPEQAWTAAARLMRKTLALLNETPETTNHPGVVTGAVSGADRESDEGTLKDEASFKDVGSFKDDGIFKDDGTFKVDGSFKPDQSRGPGELYALAAEIAERVRRLEGVNAVALGGSLGRGLADRQSDIDLLVFGRGIPREEARRHQISAWPDVAYGPLIEPACDSVLLDGAMVHIRYWTMQTVDEMLAAFPRPPAQRILAEELQNGHALVDPDGRVSEWKGVLGRLPIALVETVTDEARERLPRFREQWRIALDSDDRIHLYCLINQAVGDFLIALYIRNGRFLSTPRWTHRDIPGFPVAPADMEMKVAQLVDGIDGIDDLEDAAARWRTLEVLWGGLASLPPL